MPSGEEAITNIVERGVVDCWVRHTWGSPDELLAHIDEGWRDYVLSVMRPEWGAYMYEGGARPAAVGRTPLAPTHPFPDAGAGPPAAGSSPPNCSAEELARRHLDPNSVALAVLCHDVGALTPGLPNARLSLALAQGLNDWTVESWLAADHRLRGAIVVPNQLPLDAAAEVRRAGRHPQMSAVLMSANGLGKPFGHPAYHPIYEATAELGLPIIMTAGAEAMMDSLSSTAGGGPVATHTDYRTLLPHGPMVHLASLICQGVFDRWPDLKVIVVGAGAAWIAPFLWKFDTAYKGLRRDAPWLTDLPSDYFRRHVKVSACPLDPAPNERSRARYYKALGYLDSVLCYASGYPHSAVEPGALIGVLPARWSSRVMADNASEVLRGCASSREGSRLDVT